MTQPTPTQPASKRIVTEETVDDHVTRVGNATYVRPTVAAAEQLATRKMAALRPFHRALSLRRNSPVDILTVGHSWIQGAGGSGTVSVERIFQAQLRDALRAQFPTPGVVGGAGNFAANISVTADYPAVNTGSFTTNGNYGLGRRSWQFTGAVTLTFTFTGTGADIVWTRNTTLGTFAYTVDGGAATNVATAGALAPGQAVQIRGLAAGPHTIVVSVVSGTVLVENFVAYNGDETKGIRVWNAGRGSQQTADFVNAPNWYSSITMDPDLVVIACMLNNYAGSSYTPIDPATTKTQLLSMISSIRAKCSTPPSIVLCIEPIRQDSGATNNVAPWAEYVRIAQEIAAEDTSGPDGESLVLTYDLRERFGAVPKPTSSTGLVGGDGVHPTEAGYALWGESFARFITPA